MFHSEEINVSVRENLANSGCIVAYISCLKI